MSTSLIRAENVTMTFPGGVTALEAFSIDIHRGEVFTIVGASGCGKSTFLNLCAGFLEPTSGTVSLDGTVISGIEPRCGMVFQSYALFPWKTVRKNIEFGPALNGVSASNRRAISDRLIDMIGLQGFESSFPSELSGGMRQRVALARVLANEPDVLLCDEPFAALDAMTRQVMQEELLRIVQESGQTVVFITHSIDEALILADRVAVMSARPGRIKTLLDNDLPRPRQVDVQLSERYLELKKQIWSSVEEEVRASMLLTQEA
jgi:NitT/TauT family transport system ATP-binding protein